MNNRQRPFLSFSANLRTLIATVAIIAPLSAMSAGDACVNISGGDGTGGIGGTGAPSHGGIGGTGSPQRSGDGNGGIGGTGAPQVLPGERVGIVGTITGFASVCVNGLEVHYDNTTPVTVNGKAASTKDLAIGHVISMEAKLGPRGLNTESISILQALQGPVSQAITPGRAQQQLHVMGSPVIVTPATLGNAINRPSNPGDIVHVSGLPNSSGSIVASRIDHVPASNEHSVLGTLSGDRVHDVPVAGHRAGNREGTEVIARGQWDGERLNVREVLENPAMASLEKANRVVIEGYAAQPDPSGKVRIGRITVQIDRNTRIEGGDNEVRRGQHVTISGRLDGSRQIKAENIRIDGAKSELRLNREATGSTGGQSSGENRRSGRDDDRSGRSSSDDRSGRSGGDRVERVERIEKVEKVEKVEVIEKIERVERPDDSGRNRGGR